jgi:hypothetical protein
MRRPEFIRFLPAPRPLARADEVIEWGRWWVGTLPSAWRIDEVIE